jgi:hypothetical protein
MRLVSERPNDPLLPEDPGLTKDEEREWAVRAEVGPNGETPEAVIGLSAGREVFLDRLGRGADTGPGEPERPSILMSSG